MVGMQPVEDKVAANAGLWLDDHGDYLYAFALSRVRDSTTAEDLVQDTLLAAMQATSAFQSKSSEKTWLCGILKHKIIDYFRRSGREIGMIDDDADLSDVDHLFRADGDWKDHWTLGARPAVWNVDPEKLLERSEFRTTLSQCLGKLPERVARCFALREMDGFESSEICDILGISPTNYWVIMHRARLHLRRCIDFNWFKKQSN
jgi:RNA polymerase sigma-70 factor (ECF subfamily)